MGKPNELSFEDLAPLGPKWVEACDVCKPTRDALNALRDANYKAYDLGDAEVKGLGEVEIECNACQGKGWRLTDKGLALLKLVKHLHPIPDEEKEIPF